MAISDIENIDRPYDQHLFRSEQEDLGLPISEEDITNGNVEEQPVKSEGSLNNIWIDTYLRSTNWSPKNRGFYIDGKTGYAEFANVFVKGNIQVGSIDIPDKTSPGSFHVDSAGNTWWGAANMADAPAKVLNTGSATFKNITVGSTTIVIGPTDDVQAAINTLAESPLGGTLRLTAGEYTLTSPLVGSSPIKIIGDSYVNTVLNFGWTASNLSFSGVGMYTTGVVTGVAADLVTVSSVGTSWASDPDIATKQFFLKNKWYKIYAAVPGVGGDDSLILSEAVTDRNSIDFSGGLSYKVGYPREDVDIENVTITNSLLSGLSMEDVRNIELKDIVIQNCLAGLTIDSGFIVSMQKVFSLGNATNGTKIINSGFGSLRDMLCIGNGSDGYYFENLKTFPVYSSASMYNAASGVYFKDNSDIFMEFDTNNNGGYGMSLISGNTTMLFRQCSVMNNGTDGIYFGTNNKNNGVIGCKIEDNGNYGVNISAASNEDTIVSSNIFIGNTTSNGNDSGTGTVIRGNIGWDDNSTGSYSPFFYAGDGSDGSLTTVGNVTLTEDKYYLNLTVSTGTVFNPNGWRIFVKETLTIDGTIDGSGNDGENAVRYGYPVALGGAALPSGYLKGSLIGVSGVVGGAGGTGSSPPESGQNGNNGVNILNSIGSNGKNGTSGGAGGSLGGGSPGGSAGLAGTGGTVTASNTIVAANWSLVSMLDVQDSGSTVKYEGSASSGGGSGGGGGNSIFGMTGGHGGSSGGSGSSGRIICIYAKKIIISATGKISSNGGRGGNGLTGADGYCSPSWGYSVDVAGGGGGAGGTGGNGGIVVLAYLSLINNGTIEANGGVGGTAGAGGIGYKGDGVIDMAPWPPYYGSAGTNGLTGNDGDVLSFDFSL